MDSLIHYNRKDLQELLRLTPKEFLQETVPDHALELMKGERPGKSVFSPGHWRTCVELLRELLKQGVTPYITFRHRQPGGNIYAASGYVTTANVKYLPQLLNKAWSDITVHDPRYTTE